MKRNSVAASPRASRPEDKRADDNRDYKARLFAYGMSLKARGDALGIEWRGKSFEKYEAEVSFYEGWARPEGEVEHA